MTKEELEKFRSFNFKEHTELEDSWRYFMFSYHTFGMNFTDLCSLKQGNIKNGRIKYTRQKTGKSFDILISDEALEIIEHFRTHKEYIFPIYDESFHITPSQRKNRREKIQKQVNKDLRKIAKLLQFETDFTFYSARHTSATTLKRRGISTDVISEALGHANLRITQTYLSKFGSDIMDEAMMVL